MNEAQHYDYYLVIFDKKSHKQVNTFLRKEGFTAETIFLDYYFYYIDIINKKYVPGGHDYNPLKIIGEHAITFDEFMVIYNIYKKYRGTNPLVMDGIEYPEGNCRELQLFCEFFEATIEEYKKQIKWCLMHYNNLCEEYAKEKMALYTEKDFQTFYDEKWPPAVVAFGAVMNYV